VAQKFAGKFPTPADLFTIDSLGGWSKVKDTFFAPSTGSVTKIQQAAGFPTAAS
jgi:sulfate transport system substrate-binding protein